MDSPSAAATAPAAPDVNDVPGRLAWLALAMAGLVHAEDCPAAERPGAQCTCPRMHDLTA